MLEVPSRICSPTLRMDFYLYTLHLTSHQQLRTRQLRFSTFRVILISSGSICFLYAPFHCKIASALDDLLNSYYMSPSLLAVAFHTLIGRVKSHMLVDL